MTRGGLRRTDGPQRFAFDANRPLPPQLLCHANRCGFSRGTAPSEALARSCCGHLELAALASHARVRTLVLTHITEQFDHPGQRERVVGEISQVFKGTIVFGEDGLSVPIKAGDLYRLD